MRVKYDRTVEERHALRAMGSLWKQVQEHLKSSDQWTDGMRLGTAGRPGSLYVVAEGVAWELFSLKGVISVAAGKQDSAFDEDAGAHFKMSALLAATMIDKAVAEVQSTRRE